MNRMDSGAMPTVVVTFRAGPELVRALSETLDGVASVVFLDELRREQRAEALASAGALLSWNLPRELRPEELDLLREGQFVQLLSAGANQVPFDDLAPGVVVASNVGAFADPMAEHVLAMALALAKRLPQKHAALARGQFLQRPPTRPVAGMVAGILGFGGIGKAVARRFRPLGVRIHALNTSGTTEEEVEFVGTLNDLDTVLASSDVVVIALPLNTATSGLIGQRELSLMRPDAILVNVARGAIVQQHALYEHLRAHPEFMAGIDAWWVEPFGQGEFRVDDPFFSLPNVLGSPHNSAIVPGIEEIAARRAAENVVRWLRGTPSRGVVRREDYQG